MAQLTTLLEEITRIRGELVGRRQELHACLRTVQAAHHPGELGKLVAIQPRPMASAVPPLGMARPVSTPAGVVVGTARVAPPVLSTRHDYNYFVQLDTDLVRLRAWTGGLDDGEAS